nr:replication factor A protein 1-like [Ipomoea batatas]
MAPMYIVVREIKKNKTTDAMKLRAVRTYNVLQSRFSEEIKSRECVLHDQEHVEKVMPYFRKDFVEPVIMLIQMGRVKVSENSAEVKITSSYDATQLLFNGDSTKFLEFRESLTLQQTPLKSITSNSAYSYGNSSGGDLSSSKMRIITISDIFQNREIIGIESDVNDWFYQSCKGPGCNKKVEVNNEMFECSKCRSRYDECIYRYKINVRVVDVKSTAPFLQSDREALDLVSVKVDELLAMQPKVMIKIPKKLNTMVGRVKHFPELFNTYCPGLLDDNDDCLSSKLQLTDNEPDSDEGIFSEEEVESPNVNAVKELSFHDHNIDTLLGYDRPLDKVELISVVPLINRMSPSSQGEGCCCHQASRRRVDKWSKSLNDRHRKLPLSVIAGEKVAAVTKLVGRQDQGRRTRALP